MIKKSIILYGTKAINLRETVIFLSEQESLLHDRLSLHSFMIPSCNQVHARNDVKTRTTSFSWRFNNRCRSTFDGTDVVCLTTGPYPVSKRVLFRVRSAASSFNSQHPLFSLMSSSSCLFLLRSLRVTTIFLTFLQ